jgi:pilus assembly protein CpaB
MIVILALAFGGAAAVLANKLINQEAPAVAKTETVPVVVAAADIHRGSVITAEMVTTDNWPKDKVLPGMVTRLEDAVERVTFMPLVKGEVLLDGKLAPKGSGRGMAALTPKGMRTFTIETPKVASGVAGFIMPGNRVDVILTVAPPSGLDDPTGGGITTRLLQNIEVIAVDQNLDGTADGKGDPKGMRSVTLMVTPGEDDKLALAQTKGTLHLSLRNSQDTQAANTKPVTLSALKFLEGKNRAEAKKPPEPKKADVLPAATQTPKRPGKKRIRTLRGVHGGTVDFE